MIEIIRTDGSDKNFEALVKLLDAYLTITDGDEHDFYHQYNRIKNIKYAVVAFENGVAVACGAIKKFDKNTAELKRMFTAKASRKKGIAAKVLAALEIWAKELNFEKIILETGKRQIEAVAFYKKCNYNIIANFGQYANVENSLCFEKML